jgi:hypothetical protein
MISLRLIFRINSTKKKLMSSLKLQMKQNFVKTKGMEHRRMRSDSHSSLLINQIQRVLARSREGKNQCQLRIPKK